MKWFFVFYWKSKLIHFFWRSNCRQDVQVETPPGMIYTGYRCESSKVCGVSILRAGETMEQALCDVLKDVRLGKILIQTNQETFEPEVSF